MKTKPANFCVFSFTRSRVTARTILSIVQILTALHKAVLQAPCMAGSKKISVYIKYFLDLSQTATLLFTTSFLCKIKGSPRL